MPSAVELTSEQVRAYRILASGLDRTAGHPGQLPIWDLRAQDRDGSSRVALAARLADPRALPAVDHPGGSGWAAMAWSLRGSPHLHRGADLPHVAAALWNQEEALIVGAVRGAVRTSLVIE